MTNLESSLTDKYKDRGFISRSRELWLDQPDALAFIEDCARSGLVILGMECLVEDENGERTLLTTWADYSSVADRPHASVITTAAARKLVEGGLQDGARWATIVVHDPSRTVDQPEL